MKSSATITRIWRIQKARFLVVGGGNTVSGYVISSLLYYLLHHRTSLLAIIAVGTVINVTVSFLTNRLVVFRSRGPIIPEYLRFYLVSAAPITLNFVLLPIAIGLLKLNPYLAMAVVNGLTVVISYFGHRHITFRSQARLHEERAGCEPFAAPEALPASSAQE